MFVQLEVNALHVRHSDLLFKYHFVECSNEKGVQESAMVNGKPDDSTYEFEVAEMFRIDARVRIDLECIIVMGRVFEKAVERIEHFV